MYSSSNALPKSSLETKSKDYTSCVSTSNELVSDPDSFILGWLNSLSLNAIRQRFITLFHFSSPPELELSLSFYVVTIAFLALVLLDFFFSFGNQSCSVQACCIQSKSLLDFPFSAKNWLWGWTYFWCCFYSFFHLSNTFFWIFLWTVQDHHRLLS